MATMLCVVVCDLWLNNLSERNEPHGKDKKRHNHNHTMSCSLIGFLQTLSHPPEEETSMNRPFTKHTCCRLRPSLQELLAGSICRDRVVIVGLPPHFSAVGLASHTCVSPRVPNRCVSTACGVLATLLPFVVCGVEDVMTTLITSGPSQMENLDGIHVNVSTCRLLTLTPACTLGT